MGSEPAGVDSGTKTPPRLCYHALPNQRLQEPLGVMTPPLQAPGSVPFLWEEAPGKPRSSDGRPKPPTARRLDPPPRMSVLSSSSSHWQVAKVADAEVPSKSVLEGPYYVLLRPPASLFDGPSVMARSSSFSSSSFRHYTVGEEKRRKERSPSWFWKRASRRRDEEAWGRKKGELDRAVSVEGRRDGDCGGGEQEAAAAAPPNVTITRFKRSGSPSNPSAAGTHLWASMYEGLKQAVTGPWKTKKPASKGW